MKYWEQPSKTSQFNSTCSIIIESLENQSILVLTSIHYHSLNNASILKNSNFLQTENVSEINIMDADLSFP